MKLVEFTTSMSPHSVGDTRLVSDEKAADLLRLGAVCNVRPFPDDRQAPPRDDRRIPGKTYQTRKKG